MNLALILSVLVGIAIVIGILRYCRRPVASNLVSLVVIVVSALVSCPIAALLGKVLGKTLLGALTNMKPELTAQLSELPTTMALAPIVISLILAPILFVFIMLILRGILALVSVPLAKLIGKVVPFLGKKVLWLNICLGVLAALLLCSVYTVPLMGLSGVAVSAIEATGEESVLPSSPALDTIHDTVSPLHESPVLHVLDFGDVLFGALTTAKFEGKTIDLSREVCVMAEAGFSLTDLLGKDLAEYGIPEAIIIRGLDDTLVHSELICTVGSEVFGKCAAAWRSGQPFMGIARPAADSAVMDEVIDGALCIFEGTTPERFPSDLGAFTETLAVVTETGLLSAIASGESDIIVALQSDGSLEAVLMSLYDNEPARPLLATLLNVCTEMVVENLGVPKDPEAAAQAFTAELAKLSQSDLTVAEMTDEIKNLRNRYNVEWTDEQCAAVAQSLKDNPYDPNTAVSVRREAGFMLLATTTEANDPLSSWLTGVLNETEGDVPAPTPNIVTAADLKIDVSELENIGRENLQRFSAELPSLLAAVSGGTSGNGLLDFVGVIGPVLDIFDYASPSTAEGSAADRTVAENLLVGILQSDVGQSMIGASPADAQKMLDEVFLSKREEEADFSAMLSQMSTLVTLFGNTESDTDEVGAQMAELSRKILLEISPATTLLVKVFISEDSLLSMGIPTEQAAMTQQVMDALLETVLACRDTLSESEYDHEAEAIARLVRLFSTTDTLEINAFTHLLLESKVMSGVVSRFDADMLAQMMFMTGSSQEEADITAEIVKRLAVSAEDHRNAIGADTISWEIDEVCRLIDLLTVDLTKTDAPVSGVFNNSLGKGLLGVTAMEFCELAVKPVLVSSLFVELEDVLAELWTPLCKDGLPPTDADAMRTALASVRDRFPEHGDAADVVARLFAVS